MIISTEQNGGDEHRRDRRARVLKGAHIVFNGGYSVYDCHVRNLSPHGALLEMPSLLGIPTHFDMAIDNLHDRRPCTTMWRTNTLMGVAFDDAVAKAA